MQSSFFMVYFVKPAFAGEELCLLEVAGVVVDLRLDVVRNI